MKRLLFYRDFQHFTGGHLKVWDYFNHTRSSGIFKPVVFFSENSLRDSSNPWVARGEQTEPAWHPEKADALFVAGLDWVAVPPDYGGPVINLIQGVRHADPRDPRFAYLRRPAVRICVSHQVADAIVSTGVVDGPVVTIKNGLDTTGLPEPSGVRDILVLIAGYKQPELAARLAGALQQSGIKAHCLTTLLDRRDYLSLVARASVTIFLPRHQEGFYLPALEGMALGTFVLCPDCIGNRGFCFHEENCLQPPYDVDHIASSCREALTMLSAGSADEIIARGLRQLHNNSISEERQRFLEILQSVSI
jgi:glycosyltransferase involved in cell wall biosynthesis